MGRKIPSKKHRGVKDPLVQQAKRLESLKGKINAPPKDPDEQPVPRSLITLFGLEDKKKKKGIKEHRTHANKFHGRDRNQRGVGSNPVSRLRRAAGESGRDFSLRINSAIKALHNPADQLHYPADIEAEDVKGQRMAELRERRAKKRRRAAGQRGAGAGAGAGDAAAAQEHLTRTQKLALKKKAKQLKALEASKERQEVMYDRVSFGEVAHAPPALRWRRPAAAAAAAPGPGPADVPRPGRRELLLTRLLAGAGAGAAAGAGADRERRERARLDAVAAYRALKKSKLNEIRHK